MTNETSIKMTDECKTYRSKDGAITVSAIKMNHRAFMSMRNHSSPSIDMDGYFVTFISNTEADPEDTCTSRDAWATKEYFEANYAEVIPEASSATELTTISVKSPSTVTVE